MKDDLQRDSDTDADEFASQAKLGQLGFFAEFSDFLRHNKKWWITPIAIVLLLFAVVMILASGPGGALIYTIF